MPGATIDMSRIPGVDGTMEWTVLEERLPETIGFVPTLSCSPRAWKESPPSLVPTENLREVEVEAVSFSGRFVASVDFEQERNWLVQLLSPSFLDWLTTGAHDDFGFELHEGTLRCFRPGQLDEEQSKVFADEAERVADRIRSEAEESEGLGVRELGAGVPERIERALTKVPFATTPGDSIEAAVPFRRFAARDPRVYIAALGGVVAIFTALFGLLFEVGFDALDIIVDIIKLIGPDNSGIALGVLAVAGWIGAIPESVKFASRSYGRVAFAREYAKARGLGMESPQSFHRRLMRTELPAPAQFVLNGELGDDGRHGRLVLCRTRTRILYSYFDAVVLDPPRSQMKDQTGPGWQVAGGMFVVTRPADADRSAEGLDSFVAKALALHREVQLSSTSSTSPSGS